MSFKIFVKDGRLAAGYYLGGHVPPFPLFLDILHAETNFAITVMQY